MAEEYLEMQDRELDQLLINLGYKDFDERYSRIFILFKIKKIYILKIEFHHL